MKVLCINQKTLDALTKALSTIKDSLPNSSINALEILNYPGVLKQEEHLQEKVDELILKDFEKALDELVKTRQSEGSKLKEALLTRLDLVSKQTDIVEKSLKVLVVNERQRLKDKIANFGVDVDPQRIEQEVALAAQRSDVEEEYDRLRAHIKEVKAILDKGWENINTLFEQGKIAAVINNTGKFIDYAKAGVNYGIAPLPVNLDGKPLTPFYSTYTYAIPTRSNQKEMAQKFLAYLNVPMTTYERYLHTAELPTINDVLNSNLVSNDDFANAIFTQMHTSKQISYDKFMDFIWDPMNDALKKITIDGAEPSKTLDEAVDNMF